MLTRGEGKRQRKALDRERAAHLKHAARAKVKELRKAVKPARHAKAERVKAARAQCKRHRCMLVRRARARHARLLAELRATVIAERKAAAERCTVAKASTRASALSDVAKASHALHHERSYQRDLARIEANNREARLNIVRASKAEKKSESAGEVIANIPPELAPLWGRVGARIKGTLRKSRTEAFLEYAHQHPHEVVEAQEDRIDATIRDLESRMKTHEKRARRARYTAAELASVPF